MTDGDTVKLSNGLTVRIIGIDSPETVVSGRRVDCWGPEATNFARQTLVDKSVTVLTDPTQDRVDSVGRKLAYILLPDGRDFSVLAAEGGHARAYIDKAPPQRYVAISAAESRARAAGLGLWGPTCASTPPQPLLPLAPDPDPEPAPEPEPLPEPDSGSLAYYDNCSDARSAGAAPLYAGEPGYRSGLDRDGDGVACES
ncbi:MAG: thermonuclease family protein [Actinomycetota bacterium]|nr:thermonuclease family protein [Actinomycetota bacterium]